MSFFLFGPRQTGKSTLIEQTIQKPCWSVNLLLHDFYVNYIQDPARFQREAREKIEHQNISTIFVDEIQRIPALLNEIQYLIDAYPKCRFILTGSSARKLKRGSANLLGGRAIERHLHPFAYEEIPDQYSIDEVLRYGSLPSLFNKNHEEKRGILDAYVSIYLNEEIKNEGISRNIGGFSRFLEMAAAQCGELVNFSAISRECAIPVRTVQSYYEILEDTLIGFRLNPWRRSVRKRLGTHPKFYLFDMGVTNALNHNLTGSIDPIRKGHLFEQMIVLETLRKLHYTQSESILSFWRTGAGAEVDLLIEKHGQITAGIEIKAVTNVTGAHLSGLRAFHADHPKVPLYIASLVPRSYRIENVKILPWVDFLSELNNII